MPRPYVDRVGARLVPEDEFEIVQVAVKTSTQTDPEADSPA
jgi:hypothetical protein